MQRLTRHRALLPDALLRHALLLLLLPPLLPRWHALAPPRRLGMHADVPRHHRCDHAVELARRLRRLRLLARVRIAGAARHERLPLGVRRVARRALQLVLGKLLGPRKQQQRRVLARDAVLGRERRAARRARALVVVDQLELLEALQHVRDRQQPPERGRRPTTVSTAVRTARAIRARGVGGTRRR
eukprot:5150945-Prymnesium_polylepis.2